MDFKKTILWAVFSLSGLMLYNNWMVHEGRPSLFGGTPATTSQQAQNPTASKSDVPAQVSGATPNAAAPIATGAVADAGERFVLKNDVLVLEISANGANVVDAKLLKELTADQKPVELFQQTPTHTYIARSGLIAMGNADLPNHTSVFKLAQSGKDGSGKPFIVLSSERNGVKLEKTFILTPGSYVVDVGHRVTQATASTTPLVLYTEILRDGSQEQKIGPFGGAPWVMWIQDLSVPDPYYILPIIMAASMFVQTKLNPTPPDPIQAKVMMYMPIVFSIMFFFFPAGLVLYWVTNNLLSIAQQWQINKLFGKKAAQ